MSRSVVIVRRGQERNRIRPHNAMETKLTSLLKRTKVIMSTSSPRTLVPSAGEGSEAAARSLSQRLSNMKGHTPSISALALNGDSKVGNTKCRSRCIS